MKKKIVIFGAGGHAIVITNELKKLKRFSIFGYCVNKAISSGKKKFLSNKIFNINRANLQMMSRLSISGVIAIGDNNTRKKIVDEVKLLSNNFKWEKIISKDSFVDENVEVGDGAVIMSGCVIGPFTKIKRINNPHNKASNIINVPEGSSLSLFQDFPKNENII